MTAGAEKENQASVNTINNPITASVTPLTFLSVVAGAAVNLNCHNSNPSSKINRMPAQPPAGAREYSTP